jgi:hypothetical protein
VFKLRYKVGTALYTRNPLPDGFKYNEGLRDEGQSVIILKNMNTKTNAALVP